VVEAVKSHPLISGISGGGGPGVLAWGQDQSGDLGSADVLILSATKYSYSGTPALAAGANFSLALVSPHEVLAWGSNASGQLGSGRCPEAQNRCA